MKSSKVYQAPKVRTEAVNLGVYGCYNNTTPPDTRPPRSPIRFFNPFFHFCCS